MTDFEDKRLRGRRIVVIGAGAAGLAASIALAARGARVRVLERAPVAGGRLAQLSLGGVEFDLGEMVVTQPRVLGQLLSLANLRLSDFLEFDPVEPMARLLFGAGESLDVYSDPERLIEEIERFSREDSRRLRFLWPKWESHALAAEEAFLAVPGEGWRTWSRMALQPRAWRFLVPAVSPFSVARFANKRFPRSPMNEVAEYLSGRLGGTPGRMASPVRAWLMLMLMRGSWRPRGGMAAIRATLLRVAQIADVRIATGTEVERIHLESGMATGVSGKGFKRLRADAIVAAIDARHTVESLLGEGEERDRAIRAFRKQRPSRSSFTLLLRCDREWEELEAPETVLMSRAPIETSRQVDQWRVPAAEPNLHVVNLARLGTEIPDGAGSALRLAVAAPPASPRFAWNERTTAAERDRLISRLEAAGIDGLDESVLAESVITPAGIEQAHGLPGGSLYGPTYHRRSGWMMRPGQTVSGIPGLFLCGGSTHPGPTLPLAIESGMLAAEAITQSFVAR